ncbi:BRO-N domain-containing protein [Clostridium perfringens]|uniref:BRO-N domain-containing protein n=1 Tax=Clostridium perfringens TaxID=1502 RepID=UPI000E140722|nr:Bro-N domain-containing protein [Clostridium perfringens]MDU4023901.1 Bro-N domain-containing protein [Clostridium perfringens]SUY29660.1 BRO domain-containing protein [Clostridium perfringens]HAT4138775.1 Bro-N domain-containing protein [Clostridium perfringens]
MNDLFIKKFNDEEIITLILDNRICWIAKDVAKILNYDDPSKAINQCIKAEKFEYGIEYEVLAGDKLKEVKRLIGVTHISYLKQTPKLVIFYEEGLYGFINYSKLPIGISFRKWLRREVLPELRAKGTYSINKESYKYNLKDESENLSLYIQDKLNKERNLSLLLEVLNLIDRITSKENEDKLRCLNDILNG